MLAKFILVVFCFTSFLGFLMIKIYRFTRCEFKCIIFPKQHSVMLQEEMHQLIFRRPLKILIIKKCPFKLHGYMMHGCYVPYLQQIYIYPTKSSLDCTIFNLTFFWYNLKKKWNVLILCLTNKQNKKNQTYVCIIKVYIK